MIYNDRRPEGLQITFNPPYMVSSNVSAALSKFVKKEYPDSKSDLFATFIEKCNKMVNDNGHMALVTMHSWMFLSSYESLRKKLLTNCSFTSINHLGMEAFDGVIGKIVATVAFTMQNTKLNRSCIGVRLTDYYDSRRYEKERAFFYEENRTLFRQNDFLKIPGLPFAYWVKNKAFKAFGKGNNLADMVDSSVGIQSGDNDRFIHYWWEVDDENINREASCMKDSYGEKKWFPYNKGGEYRKWYGNDDSVIDWKNDGENIKNNSEKTGHHYQQYRDELKFNPLITWSRVSSIKPAFRYKSNGFLSDMAGFSLYANESKLKSLIGFCNSCVAEYYLGFLSPTINYMIGQVTSLPIIFEDKENEVNNIAGKCIEISKTEWDAFENSWDFEKHPLINNKGLISEAYEVYKESTNTNFACLKTNEKELNRIFIKIYNLNDELCSEVSDKDISVTRIYDTKEEIPDSMKGNNYVLTKEEVVKSFISYAVGCMFGRYSLDIEGLAYAGGEWDDSKYKTFLPDTDAIIPICDDEYFEDDIVGRFVQFVEVVYGKDTLEENLQFIADALGGKGTSREVIRNYFVSSFYADHVKTYKKRPIYWLFDSGKKNGFKCLIYMHRYQPDTLARIRTDYIHEQQSRYRTVIESLEQRIVAAGSSSEKVKLTKLLNTRQAQAKEIREYEEKVHHLADQMIKIDLDDGVKHNYAIFKDVLAKIK